MQCVALVAAGGQGVRLGVRVPKAFADVSGFSLLAHTVARMREVARVRSIVVAVPADHVESATAHLRAIATPSGDAANVTVIAGGVLRQDSVRRMLAVVPPGTTHVLVHDAARALAPASLADRVLDALADGAEAVVPVLPVVDTLASVSDERVTGTVPRDSVRLVQTPQGFAFDLLVRAHDISPNEWEATDDSSMVMRLGASVHAVPGDRAAMKITTPEDLLIAQALLHK